MIEKALEDPAVRHDEYGATCMTAGQLIGAITTSPVFLTDTLTTGQDIIRIP